jgi:hypothetical protein
MEAPMAKKALITRKQLNAFIPKFNEDHNYTKIVGVKTDTHKHEGRPKLMCWTLTVKVVSYKDKRKKLCEFSLNVWPKDDTLEKVKDTINDMYRGMRDFFDCNEGVEDRVIGKADPIRIILTDENDVKVRNVPAGIELVVDDEKEGGYARYGKGNDNIVFQKA